MIQSNLHYRLVLLLLCFGITMHFTNVLAAEQRDKPNPDKAGLIKVMKEMRTASRLDIAQIDAILEGLGRLSSKDGKDTVLLREIHDLSVFCLYDENTDQAKQLMFKKLALKNEVGSNKSFIYEWQVLAEIYISEGNLDSARWYLNKAEARGQAVNDPYIMNTKALIAVYEGKYLEASQLMVQVIDLFRRRNAGLELATAKLNLSRIYRLLEMYHKSLKLAKEARQYFKVSGTNRQLLMTGNNLSSIYRNMDSTEQAIRWNRENITLARRINHDVELAKGYMNLGNALSGAGNYTLAELYLDSSLMIAQKLGLGYGELLYHYNKAFLCIRRRLPEAALRELEEVKKLNEIYSDIELRQGYYEAMYKANEQLKRYEEAFAYYKLSDEIKDSLDQKQATQFLLEWEQLIEKERSAKEIAELNLAVSKYRFQLIIIIILAIVVFLTFRGRARMERKKTRLAEEEQARLNAEIEMKNRELTSKAILNASMSEMIDDMIRELKQFTVNIKKESITKFTLMIRDLETRKPTEDWKEFETRFTQVHEAFHEKLLRICPELSPSELKLCSLLRLNISSKEIAMLTNRSKATIDNTRSIIRKKLNLTPDENLTSYLMTI
jgi:tetratricopeptide (TPR) repeat protein